MKKSYLLTGSVLLLVLLVAVVLLGQPNNAPAPAPEPLPTQATTPTPAPTAAPQPRPVAPAAATTNVITATASQPAGTSITVSSVTLTAPSFLVVYEATSDLNNPTFGKQLAASSLLPKGTSKNVVIKMTTSPSELYLVTARRDNGNRLLSAPEDPFVTDASGKPLSVAVTADLNVVSSPKTVYVDLKDSLFTPSTLTVKKGDSVFFANKDAYPHTVTANAFGGRHLLNVGQSYVLETKNLAPGTYRYVCEFHSGMAGTLIVK